MVFTLLIGFAGVAIAIASSALGNGEGNPRSAIGDVLIAFGMLALLAVPIVASLGRRVSAWTRCSAG